MKRRQFLTVGTAVMAAPALPSVTAHAAPPAGTLPSRAEIVAKSKCVWVLSVAMISRARAW